MKKVTTVDVGTAIGLTKVEAAGLLKALVRAGKASIVGCRKTSAGKGRPTPIYGIEDSVALDFSGVIEAKGEILPVMEPKSKKQKNIAQKEQEDEDEGIENQEMAEIN